MLFSGIQSLDPRLRGDDNDALHVAFFSLFGVARSGTLNFWTQKNPFRLEGARKGDLSRPLLGGMNYIDFAMTG
jgi:hypothetical protein